MIKDGLIDLYYKPLTELFESNKCPANAIPMKRYMKDISEFLGLKSDLRKKLQSEFFREYGYPKSDNLFSSVIYLWSMPFREYQYSGMDLMVKPSVKLSIQDIEPIEYMITTKSWWDTADFVAASLAGKYFRLFPEKITTVTGQWIESDNIWLKRSALLFQLKYKSKTDEKLLFDYIKKESSHKDFFIRKAIGWALREYSKSNPLAVKEFIHNNVISPLSKKEGLKIINKKESSL